MDIIDITVAKKKALAQSVATNQGAANAGKVMGIDSEGNVVPVAGSQGGAPSAGDVSYSDQASYDDGTVGKAVTQLKSDFNALGLSVVNGKLCVTYTA